VLDALVAERHPIGPGAAGENLLLSDLEWSALRPGVRLAIGGAAVVELTGWADPCTQIAGCFTDRSFERIDHARHPGWSRAYASVVCPGPVEPGDGVRVLP
jgi:MOSC domain-containing protein YiiM